MEVLENIKIHIKPWEEQGFMSLCRSLGYSVFVHNVWPNYTAFSVYIPKEDIGEFWSLVKDLGITK